MIYMHFFAVLVLHQMLLEVRLPHMSYLSARPRDIILKVLGIISECEMGAFFLWSAVVLVFQFSHGLNFC